MAYYKDLFRKLISLKKSQNDIDSINLSVNQKNLNIPYFFSTLNNSQKLELLSVTQEWAINKLDSSQNQK